MSSEIRQNKLMGFTINTKPLTSILDECARCLCENEWNFQSDAPFKQALRVMSCANPHSFAQTPKDVTFMKALKNADYLIADGVGVTLAAKCMGLGTVPRITGHDFFCGINERFSTLETTLGRKVRVLFFGSSASVLEQIKSRFQQDYPNLHLCELISPPYREWSEEENEALLQRINATKPDVIWVGMTAPKQEKWVYRNRDRLNASVVGNVGAVFDFYAGTYPRAPEWACKAGVEWLFRLLKEPKRMWRRTFVSGPTFLLLSLLSAFSR